MYKIIKKYIMTLIFDLTMFVIPSIPGPVAQFSLFSTSQPCFLPYFKY